MLYNKNWTIYLSSNQSVKQKLHMIVILNIELFTQPPTERNTKIVKEP